MSSPIQSSHITTAAVSCQAIEPHRSISQCFACIAHNACSLLQILQPLYHLILPI